MLTQEASKAGALASKVLNQVATGRVVVLENWIKLGGSDGETSELPKVMVKPMEHDLEISRHCVFQCVSCFYRRVFHNLPMIHRIAIYRYL